MQQQTITILNDILWGVELNGKNVAKKQELIMAQAEITRLTADLEKEKADSARHLSEIDDKVKEVQGKTSSDIVDRLLAELSGLPSNLSIPTPPITASSASSDQ